MSEYEKDRNRTFNLGYRCAFADDEIDLEQYETNVHYRRGYDAGERDRDEDQHGDHDPLSPDEMKMIYGEEEKV